MIANKHQREVMRRWQRDIEDYDRRERLQLPLKGNEPTWDGWMRFHYLPMMAMISFQKARDFPEAYRMLDGERAYAVLRHNAHHHGDIHLVVDSSHLCHFAASLMQQLERCAENETSPAV
ncbi:MAG: hypothetical protein RIT25_1456 [Planctomycetota bacterium]